MATNIESLESWIIFAFKLGRLNVSKILMPSLSFRQTLAVRSRYTTEYLELTTPALCYPDNQQALHKGWMPRGKVAARIRLDTCTMTSTFVHDLLLCHRLHSLLITSLEILHGGAYKRVSYALIDLQVLILPPSRRQLKAGTFRRPLTHLGFPDFSYRCEPLPLSLHRDFYLINHHSQYKY